MLNRYRAVFESLHRHNVRYVVIGGIAAVIHGVPRATFDLDILIEATFENARNLLEALNEAGLGTALMTDAQGLVDQEITVFKDFVRIDVQTSTPGITFEIAWQNHLQIEFEGQLIEIIRLEDLIATKTASGRPVDLQDVALLKLAIEPNIE